MVRKRILLLERVVQNLYVERGAIDLSQPLISRQLHAEGLIRRAAGEREDRERAAFRSTDQRTRQLQASEKKDRMERELAHRMDLQRSLDRIQREHEAPVLQQYIACVKEEPLLMHDDVAAARALGWTVARVSDVKRRLNLHIAKLAAEQRWKSLFPKGL